LVGLVLVLVVMSKSRITSIAGLLAVRILVTGEGRRAVAGLLVL
jgi:hypothetical protein